jgi:tetratricopeptide (TPR) repeat protein
MWRCIKSTFMAIGASLLISGCAKSTSAPPAMLREMARSYLIGTTYDKALIAAQQDNQRAVRESLRQLDQLNATSFSADLQLSRAEDLVRAAENLDVRAEQLKTQSPMRYQQIKSEAGQQYRAALRWSPEFPSDDPLLLNALGYYLADRGHSKADFELAAELTNRAIALLQKSMAGNRSQRALNQIAQQQALTRDSYAWALYKLKRYDEAETAQRAAWAQANSSGMKDRVALAELKSHLAEILKARDKKANDAMKELQRLQEEIKKGVSTNHDRNSTNRSPGFRR